MPARGHVELNLVIIIITYSHKHVAEQWQIDSRLDIFPQSMSNIQEEINDYNDDDDDADDDDDDDDDDRAQRNRCEKIAAQSWRPNIMASAHKTGVLTRLC